MDIVTASNLIILCILILKTLSIIKNHRIIKVKMLPPTNKRGRLIKLSENRFNKTEAKTLNPLVCYQDDYCKQAIDYLTERHIVVTGFGYYKGEYYIFSDTWPYNEEWKSIK